MKKNLLLMVFLCMGVQLVYAPEPVADGSVGGAPVEGSFGGDPASPWFDDAGEDDPRAEELMRLQALKYDSQPLPPRDEFGYFTTTNGKTQSAQTLSQGDGQSTVALTGPGSEESASFNSTAANSSLSRGSRFTGVREWAKRQWKWIGSFFGRGRSKPISMDYGSKGMQDRKAEVENLKKRFTGTSPEEQEQTTKLNLRNQLKELQESMRLLRITPEEFSEKAKALQELLKLINDPREKQKTELLLAEQKKEAEQLKKADKIMATALDSRYELTPKEQRESDINDQVKRYRFELEAQIGKKGSTLQFEDINRMVKQRREELEKAFPEALATKAREVRKKLGQRGSRLSQVKANLRELEAAGRRMNGTLSQ